MKLPRDLDAAQLAQALTQFGYQITRQTGSHMRLTTQEKGEHHITIPNYSPLKVGTLSAILRDVAEHLELTREELLQRLL